MSGYISEFFGYRAEDTSTIALDNTSKQICPFLSSYCTNLKMHFPRKFPLILLVIHFIS